MPMDTFADIFLSLTSLPVIFLITFIGALLYGRAFFFQTTCLLGINIIINVALKGTFKIPMSPYISLVGYAFPSGHMQLATVFYVWIALYLPSNAYKALIALLLVGIGIALTHFGYHSFNDVMAGCASGLLVVSLFDYLLKGFFKNLSGLVLACSSILMAYIILSYNKVPYHAWVAYGILVSIIIAEKLASIKKRAPSLWIRIKTPLSK